VPEVKTCLWFETDAEPVVRRYVELVPDSRIVHVRRSPCPRHAGQAGDVIVIDFALGGQAFMALNGGTHVECGTARRSRSSAPIQKEVDRLWGALTADCGAEARYLMADDRLGVPWQIVPAALPRPLGHADRALAAPVFRAMQTMVKIDVAALERAAQG